MKAGLDRNNRRGAALLIIIGLLSLLLIAAVAFSVLMTVERNAASNYRHSMQARQILFAGLARALADIDASVGDLPYPPWTNGTRLVGTPYTNGQGQVFGRTVTTYEDLFASCDSSVTTTNPAAICSARVLSRDTLPYLPRSLHKAAQTAKSEVLAFSPGGDPIGRYAYVVANVSGLLDVHTVNRTNRWCGANPGEITLANDTPFDVTNALNFAYDCRFIDFRYESIPELAALNTGVDPAKLSNLETFSYAPPDLDPEGNPKVFLGGDSAQLASRYSAITGAFAKCGITGNDAINAYRALIDYVDTNDVPEGASDSEKFDRPASENVPQLQHVSFYTKYSRTKRGPTTYEHNLYSSYLVLFWSFPAVASLNQSFTLKATAQTENESTDQLWSPLLPGGGNLTTYTNESSHEFSPMPNAPFLQAISLNDTTVTNDTTVANMPRIRFYVGVQAQALDADGYVVEQVPGDPTSENNKLVLHIDHTFGKSQPDLDIDINEEIFLSWAEALDPSCNWTGYPSDRQWLYSDSFENENDPVRITYSLTNMNQRLMPFGSLIPLTDWGDPDATAVISSNENNVCGGLLTDFLLSGNDALTWWNTNAASLSHVVIPDGATIGANTYYWDPPAMWKRHFVKDRPLDSVGELGYLPIGAWMTINLYPHNHNLSALSLNPLPASKFHPVLDYFTLRATNEIRRGLVNLNSRNGHVHAAVLNQMPLREWVGSSTPKLDNTHARGFGDWISTAGISFSNLSGLATIWMGVDDLGQRNELLITDSTRSPPSCMLSTQMVSSVGSGSFGEFEREALIRNAAALYTTRQQIYTIIVRADAMSLAYGGGSALDGNILNSGSVLGSARGVFQVWRDPVPDANGNHPYFVRLCKILN